MILFSYPNISVDEQVMQVSLFEGLIDFAKSLTKENIKVVGMNLLKYVLYEAEPEIWFILIIKAPVGNGQDETVFIHILTI